MNRWWIVALAALIVSGMATSAAHAQFPIGGYAPPQMPSPPPFSPYLNLNRAGTAPGINYFGLVRPQQQTAQQLQSLQNQQGMPTTDASGATVTPGQPVPMSTTGHPVYYFDYARFFPPTGLPYGVGVGGVGGGVPPIAGGGFGRGTGNLGIGLIAR
jgi:hypothetical protein